MFTFQKKTVLYAVTISHQALNETRSRQKKYEVLSLQWYHSETPY